MISIIICSRTPEISASLLYNIQKTIGVDYELIVIDNSENNYSIFEAYNIGFSKSKNGIVCFIHDDINMLTQNWGQVLIEIFDKNNDVGLVGVGGAKSKTKMPSAWWNCGENDRCINIKQYFNGQKVHWHTGFDKTNLQEVVTIDGVFMATRKTNSILFNTKLKGFHNYDLNLSFEYLKNGYKIVVTNEILLEHYSIGTINKDWFLSSIFFYDLYKDILPQSISENNNLKYHEFKNGKFFVTKLFEYGLKKQAVYFWFKLILLKPFSKFHFQTLIQILK
ncbi:glycosyltransferase [Flavobacterium sp. ACN6]|uniref:glycosyltransferase n=1 Tax=Flavobacterium sp. ACN6 TaxID=1920426 RepID=UPI000BB35157|nr:glycosyltransferase [Flavobacterium sp. ACN6]PBJ13851.1 hypothetical protein BSF42_13300 [Flavobacterium sp. ACN6]